MYQHVLADRIVWVSCLIKKNYASSANPRLGKAGVVGVVTAYFNWGIIKDCGPPIKKPLFGSFMRFKGIYHVLY